MSFAERHMSLVWKGQTYLIPVYAKVSNPDPLELKFEINTQVPPMLGIDYVIVVYHNGFVDMITSGGNPLEKGPIYDFLLE